MLKAFSIRDDAVEAFDRPFFARSVGEAERVFGDLARDANHPVGKHPHDYHLYLIGSFDEVDGTIAPELPPVRVASGIEYTKAPQLEAAN